MNIPPLISRTPPPLPDDDDDDEEVFGNYVIGDILENGSSDIYDIDVETIVPSGYDYIERDTSSLSRKSNDDKIDTVTNSYQESIEICEPQPIAKDEITIVTSDFKQDVTTSSILTCDSRASELFSDDIGEVESNSQPTDILSVPTSNTNENFDHSNQFDGETSDVALEADFGEQPEVENEFDSFQGVVTISDHNENHVSSENLSYVGSIDTENGKQSPVLESQVDPEFCVDHVTCDTSICCTSNEISNVPVNTNTINAKHDVDLDNAERTAYEFSIEEEEDDDEFSDFTEFQTNTDGLNGIASSQEKEIKRDFISESTNIEVSDVAENFTESLLDDIKNNSVWTHLQFLEDTPALKYQWLSSTSNHKLLTSLKIDSRNIFCGPWSRSVKCLAPDVNASSKNAFPNIGDNLNAHHESCFLHNSSVDVNGKVLVPDAHFDWEGSGLVNPLFSSAKDDSILQCDIRGIVGKEVTEEAHEILTSLPDLSYITKTYIVFKKPPASH